MTLEGVGFIGLRGKSAEEIEKYSVENVTDSIRQYANEAKVGPEFREIQDDIINYFLFHNVPTNATSSFYIQRNAELFSDLIISQQVLYETDLKVKAGWPIYFYVWNHISAPVQATLPAAKGLSFKGGLLLFFG
uniref:Uncharacterized protein n=1 Tax=Panagrolaimus superbus TaxID=310955 RepID=A0A914YH76_9BILA